MSSKTTSMRAAALIMALSVLLSRIIGLVREQFVAWRFGATSDTDLYLAAFTLPDFLNYLLAGGALSITFVPIYSKYLADQQEQEGQHVFSAVVSFLLAVLLVGTGLGMLFAEPVLSWYFSAMPADKIPQLVRLTRIVFPAQIFHVIGAIVTATLFAKGKFTAAALSPVIYNLAIIAGGAIFGGAVGIEGMAWGVLVGAMLGPFLVPALNAKKLGLGFSFRLDLSHPGFRTFIKTAIPLMLGVSLVTVDEWIARYICAGDEGSITQLNYARKILLVPVGFLAQAGGVASYPFFAKLFAEGKKEEMAQSVISATRTVLVLSLFVTALILPLSGPIITGLFAHGKFTTQDAAETAPLLVWYISGLAGWGLQSIWGRACYATGDTWRPMIISSLIVVASIPLFFFCYARWGVSGLALASTAGITAQALLLIPVLRHHLPEMSFSPVLDGLWRSALSSGIAGFGVYVTARNLPTFVTDAGSFSRLLGVGILMSICGLVFLILLLPAAKLLGLSEIDKILRRIRR
jgi:putative peptidoglycan lipid II flippase